jgi:hypothetical protein
MIGSLRSPISILIVALSQPDRRATRIALTQQLVRLERCLYNSVGEQRQSLRVGVDPKASVSSFEPGSIVKRFRFSRDGRLLPRLDLRLTRFTLQLGVGSMVWVGAKFNVVIEQSAQERVLHPVCNGGSDFLYVAEPLTSLILGHSLPSRGSGHTLHAKGFLLGAPKLRTLLLEL